MGEILLGCSGWNYPDTVDKGGWTGVFYTDKETKRLRYYSQFFNTAEMVSPIHTNSRQTHFNLSPIALFLFFLFDFSLIHI